jgi:hypothetical protein
LAEADDEIAVKQWFAPAEADAAARSQEVEVVLHQLFHQLFRRRPLPDALRLPALAIQAIAAAQRATVKSHQRGDACAVGGKAVTGNGYEWGGFIKA